MAEPVLSPADTATPPEVDAISIEVAVVPCKLSRRICSFAPPLASRRIEGAPLKVDWIIISAADVKSKVPVKVKVPATAKFPPTTTFPELSTVKAPVPTLIPPAPRTVRPPAPVVVRSVKEPDPPLTGLVTQSEALDKIRASMKTAPVDSLTQVVPS